MTFSRMGTGLVFSGVLRTQVPATFKYELQPAEVAIQNPREITRAKWTKISRCRFRVFRSFGDGMLRMGPW